MEENNRIGIIHRLKFASSVKDNGCVEFRGSAHPYGLVGITAEKKKRTVPAARAMYMAENSCFDLPSSIRIKHTCGNIRCINKDHLVRSEARAQTPRVRKNRGHSRIVKLSNCDVMVIRMSSETNVTLAKTYGVSKEYVSRIRNGKAKALVTV